MGDDSLEAVLEVSKGDVGIEPLKIQCDRKEAFVVRQRWRGTSHHSVEGVDERHDFPRVDDSEAIADVHTMGGPQLAPHAPKLRLDS